MEKVAGFLRIIFRNIRCGFLDAPRMSVATVITPQYHILSNNTPYNIHHAEVSFSAIRRKGCAFFLR